VIDASRANFIASSPSGAICAGNQIRAGSSTRYLGPTALTTHLTGGLSRNASVTTASPGGQGAIGSGNDGIHVKLDDVPSFDE